jgi:hypothetical protein
MVISGGYIILDVDAIYTQGDYEIDCEDVTYTGGTIVDEYGNTIAAEDSGSTSDTFRR